MKADLAPNFQSDFEQEIPLRHPTDEFPAQAHTPVDDTGNNTQTNFPHQWTMDQSNYNQFVQKGSNVDVL